MTPQESNSTVEIQRTPETIIEAVRSGNLVKAVRAGFQFYNARPLSLVELAQCFHPEVEYHTRTDMPDQRTYRGREEWAHFSAEWIDAFDDFHLEPVEIFETDGRVVGVVQLIGRIKGSDQQVEMETAYVYSFRDGLVSEVREYATKREALKALGLSESATFANRFAKPS